MSDRPVASRSGGRARIFTPAVLRIIPQWVNDGVPKKEIAAALGVKVSSLKVICATNGVALRPAGTTGGPALEKRLGPARWAELRHQAARRNITPFQLAGLVLAAAVDGKLLDAILDDAEDLQ